MGEQIQRAYQHFYRSAGIDEICVIAYNQDAVKAHSATKKELDELAASLEGL